MSNDKVAAAMHDGDASIGEVEAPVPEVPEDEREPVETWALRAEVETTSDGEPVETVGRDD